MSAFLVFSVLVLSGCFNRVVSSLNEEGLALLALKSSIKEDPEGSLSNWNYSDPTPCSWNGITCKAQKVVSISIPRKKLSGFLPATLGSLAELRHVNLRSNKLAGNLPPELFKLQGLQSLVLYENSFSGPLQSEVGNLVYLQTLDLSRNFFNGSLPPSLVQCKRLRYLDFSGNNFSGSLPSGLGHNLTFLEKLDLSYNFFTGSIPGDMGYLSNLQGTLDLSHNTLDGLIPASLGNLPEKIYIDLTYNNLSGPIPQNGALVNRGPTAFVGNPALCGPPLKSLCSSGDEATSPTSFPYIPSNHRLPGGGGTAANSGHGLSKAALIAIIIGDVIGICVIGLLFSCCYSTFCAKKKGENGHGGPEKGGYGGRKDCLCFRKEESETQSEHVDRCELVALDGQVGFDLDELLKAPAFVLGKSGIGIVYRVVLEDGLTLAVRRLGEGGLQRFKEFKTEVETIGRLRHPNIVTLRAYYWSDDEKLLIYDFIRNGNLGSAIHGKPGSTDFTPLSWPARLKIMKGVAKGLLHLHEYSPKKYVHGDLKPTNVLLAHDMEPKISDFGLARLAHITDGPHSPYFSRTVPDRPDPESISIVSGPNLGPYYQAPEAPKALKPSQKWDVYSYGVILLEMLTGRAPMALPGNPEAVDLVRWVQACIDEKKPVCNVLDPALARDSDKEEEMIAVLKTAMACTHVGPEKRPSMRNVWDALERLPVSED